MAGNRFWNRWGFSREDGEARVPHVSLPPLGPNELCSRRCSMQHNRSHSATRVELSTPSTGTPVSRAPTLPPMSRCVTPHSPWTPAIGGSFGMDRGRATPESSTISPNSYYMSMYPSPANTSGTPARRPGGTPSQYNPSPNRYARSPLWTDDFDRMTPLPRNVVSPDPCLCEVFVLYASPIANYTPIDFESEIDRIVCSARESERLQTGQVQVSVGMASSASLTKLLTLSHGRVPDAPSRRPALILHLAAHGDEAGGLILESAKGTGEAHPCSHEKLRSLLHSESGENGDGGLRGVSLLMLSSCSSKQLAQVFIDSGCQHVIATSRPVLDKTAKAFTERFYGALFVGKSIVDAFEHAKEALLASSHPEVAEQSNAYHLLKGNEGDVQPSAARSESWTIPDRPWSRDSDIEGFQDACSFLDTLEFLPPRVEDFYRPNAMQHVLNALRNRRACAVHGCKGIGKSALAIELSRFAASSGRLFSGNVLHVRLEEKGEALSTIKEAVDFFALRHPFMPLGRNDAGCTVWQLQQLERPNAHMLLVLDDECNALESKPLRSLLAEVLRKTHRWALLLCSRSPFRESLGFTKVVSVKLGGLEACDSASLLLRRVHRPLEPKDFMAVTESLSQGRARAQLRQNNEATKLLVMSQLLNPLEGHPGLLCYVGSQVYDGGPSLRDVVQEVSSKDKEEVMASLELN